MKPEYAELLDMMKVWHEEIGVSTLTIPYTVHGDWEVEICGYEDYPKLRELLARETRIAKAHYVRLGELGPITIALVYDDLRNEVSISMNGEFWALLDESCFS